MHLLFLRARGRHAFYASVLMLVVSCVFLLAARGGVHSWLNRPWRLALWLEQACWPTSAHTRLM